MLLPLTTDAPIYHLPIATVGLIVANFVCFFANGSGIDDVDHAWILHFGTINPLEWLTNMFSHADAVHLVGNMYFLWTFGFVVEGKLGWFRMLKLYLLIGITQSALVQFIMYIPGGTGALGASSAIMGLMAVCLVWAPKNEFSVLMFFLYRVFWFDVTIMWLSVWYLFWDSLSWLFMGFSMSTPALHLSGALVGFALGVLYVKKDWVDCENWDLFAVLKGTYGRFGDPSTTVGSHADPALLFGKEVDVSDIRVAEFSDDSRPRIRHDDRQELRRIERLIDAGHALDASESLMLLRLTASDALLDEIRLKRLATGLIRANAIDESEIALEEYVRRFPESAAWARLKIAQILLVERQRPAAALRSLKQIRLSQLSEDQQILAKKVAAEAKRQVKAGVEDTEEEW
ncbi:MAG: rhomboid family intramembrane serine protease [Planctomycetaceae bacterium]